MEVGGVSTEKLVSKFYELKVKDVMDSRHWDLPVVDMEAPIEHVLTILMGKNHAWVVDDMKARNLIGIITEKDFLAILAPLRPAPYSFGFPNIKSLKYGTAQIAKDLMTTKIITCTPEATIREVIGKMVGYRVRRLPVVETGDKIVGEITLSTILRKYRDALSYHDIKNR